MWGGCCKRACGVDADLGSNLVLTWGKSLCLADYQFPHFYLFYFIFNFLTFKMKVTSFKHAAIPKHGVQAFLFASS